MLEKIETKHKECASGENSDAGYWNSSALNVYDKIQVP